jgi:hypothetical protein
LADPAAGFQDHTERVLTLAARDDVANVAYDGFFEPTTLGATLEQYYVWDMLVHRWDNAYLSSVDGDTLLLPSLADTANRGLCG